MPISEFLNLNMKQVMILLYHNAISVQALHSILPKKKSPSAWKYIQKIVKFELEKQLAYYLWEWNPQKHRHTHTHFLPSEAPFLSAHTATRTQNDSFLSTKHLTQQPHKEMSKSGQ